MLDNVRAPKKIDEGQLCHKQLFVNKRFKLRTDMTGEQFLELLRQQEEFKPMLNFLDHYYPNLRNHIQLLGREAGNLYVVGKEDNIIESMNGASLIAARGPQSRRVADQRLYICEYVKRGANGICS